MKEHLSVFSLVILLCFVIGCQQATKEPAVEIGAEREAVSQAISALNHADNSKDMEAMPALVAEEGLFSRAGYEFWNKIKLGEYWSSQFSQGNSWTCYPPEKKGNSYGIIRTPRAARTGTSSML